jgi:hypothetical protein
MTFTDTADTAQFVDRYICAWHEPDPTTRRKLVQQLWSADAVQYTDANEYRGHEALEQRVTAAYNQFVEQGGYVSRREIEPATHHSAVLIRIEMVPGQGGQPAWAGTIIALLGGDGRIEREYQFGRNL